MCLQNMCICPIWVCTCMAVLFRCVTRALVTIWNQSCMMVGLWVASTQMILAVKNKPPPSPPGGNIALPPPPHNSVVILTLCL